MSSYDTLVAPRLMGIIPKPYLPEIFGPRVEGNGNIRLSLNIATLALAGAIYVYHEVSEMPARPAHEVTTCSVHPEGQAVIFDNETDDPLRVLFTQYTTDLFQPEDLTPEALEIIIGSCVYFTIGMDGIQKWQNDAFASGNAGHYLGNDYTP